MDGWLDAQWLGNPARAWVFAAAGALLGFLLAYLVVAVAASRCRALAQARPGGVLEVAAAVLGATRAWLLLALAVVIAGHFLDWPGAAGKRLGQLMYLLIGLQLAFWMDRLITTTLGRLARHQDAPGNPVIFGVLKWTAQLVVWATLLLAVLGNAGVNVNAFIASLGVGGVAVALAAQNVLGDLFASISIGLDKPFEVGEFIAFGADLGTVRRVGIKSTRIQSLSGEEIAIANALLLQEKVHNYSRMRERRVVFGFRVAIDTPRAKAERTVQELRRIVSSLDKVRFDRAHMTAFGEGWLEFECVYYMLDPDYAAYRDAQQQINFQLMDALERLQVQLAVPVRALQGSRWTHREAPAAA
jgi:small-conductance mechanosensitive channel